MIQRDQESEDERGEKGLKTVWCGISFQSRKGEAQTESTRTTTWLSAPAYSIREGLSLTKRLSQRCRILLHVRANDTYTLFCLILLSWAPFVGTPQKEHHKTSGGVLGASYNFWGLGTVGRVMSAERHSRWNLLTQTTCWSKTHGEIRHLIFGGSINKTQWTVTKAELGLLVDLAVRCLLVSRLWWSSLSWQRHCWELPLFLVIRIPPVDSCWFFWGLDVPTRSCHCFTIQPLLNWTSGISMKCLWVD